MAGKLATKTGRTTLRNAKYLLPSGLEQARGEWLLLSGQAALAIS